MKVLIASRELSPFTKGGEIGNSVKDLALALKDQGCEVAFVLPAYSSFLEQMELSLLYEKDLSIGKDDFKVAFFKAEFSGIPLYLVYSSVLLLNDQAERSVFFCRLASILLRALEPPPDILIANDWDTGLLIPFAKEEVKDISTVFVIHNMSHGLVPLEKKEIVGLSDSYYEEEKIGFYGQISLLKAGIFFSDAVVTLSPTYAEEIQKPEFGAGVDKMLKDMNHKLYGILNGCNYNQWNPETDLFIKRRYSENDLDGKLVCKQDLIEKLKIADKTKAIYTPIIAMPTELEEHKGCSLVIRAASRLAEMNVIVAVLGKGDPIVENIFWELCSVYPDNFYLLKDTDQVTLHRLIAGADMVLIPSLFEPCGVTQMYAMRYGTLPIVRATGGLNDTVTDPTESFPGTGFKFYKADPYDMLKAIERAISTYKDAEMWKKMMKNAMKQRFLWSSCAKEYIRVFRKLKS
jgi:starch synthase